MTTTFDHVGLVFATNEQVADVAAFFGEVLGLPVGDGAESGYAEVTTGGPTISLHRGALADVGAPGGTILQFRSPDVRAEAKAVADRGGRLALEPTETDWGTISAYVAGPHGVTVELYQFV
jgi:predicted enzyme related to lactoylglutathione lyase